MKALDSSSRSLGTAARPGSSVCLVIDRFSVAPMTQPLINRRIDRLLEKPHRSIAEARSLPRLPACELPNPPTNVGATLSSPNSIFWSSSSAVSVSCKRGEPAPTQRNGLSGDAVDRVSGVAEGRTGSRRPIPHAHSPRHFAHEDRLGKTIRHIGHTDMAVQEEDAVIVLVDRRLDVVMASCVAGPAWLAATGRWGPPCVPAMPGRAIVRAKQAADPAHPGGLVGRVVGPMLEIKRSVDPRLFHVGKDRDDPAQLVAAGFARDRADRVIAA